MGVDKVIDYKKQEVSKEQKFDLIFDASGNFTISDLKDNLTDEAMFVSTRGRTNDVTGVAEAVIDVVFQKRMKIVKEEPNTEDLNKLKELSESGKLKPYIAQTFSLEDIAQAHQLQEDGGFTGKIAIKIDS